VTSPGEFWVVVTEPEDAWPVRERFPPLIEQGETFEVQVTTAGRVVQTPVRGMYTCTNGTLPYQKIATEELTLPPEVRVQVSV
jgi:hypothetical protein